MGEYSHISIRKSYACISDDKKEWQYKVSKEGSNKSIYRFKLDDIELFSGRYIQIGFNFLCNNIKDAKLEIEDINIYVKPIFNDSRIENAVRYYLGRETDNIALTRKDLIEISELNISGENKSINEKLNDLSGLEYCTNLTDLRLPYNNLESDDLIKINSLDKLEYLDLCGNNISDIESLMISYDFLPPSVNMSHDQQKGSKFRFENLKYLNIKKTI